MGRLESFKKPLDADVEKDGAKEIRYNKDSYDYLFDEDELFMAQQFALRDELQIDEDDKASYEDSKYMRDEMAQMIAESEMPDELWGASDLGKYTINTPVQQKNAVKEQEQYMKPVSEFEFQEISDDADKEDIEMQKKFEEMMKQLEEEMGF